jgi:hypothetical protein
MLQYIAVRPAREQRARFAQLKTIKRRVSNPKMFAAQIVEQNSTRYQVTPRHIVSEKNTCSFRKGFDVLYLN